MNDPILRHLSDPENAGELPDAHGRGLAGDPCCGAVIEVSVRFDKEIVTGARFLASGSSAAIAAGNVLTGLIKGSSWRRAAALPAAEIVKALEFNGSDGRARSSRLSISAAAEFAVEALHRALEDAIRSKKFPVADRLCPDTVLVAMSGGVDSSVACLLERESGRRVVGLTMRLWSDPSDKNGSSISCCSPRAIRDARAVCHSLDVPHLTVDLASVFEKAVVDDFVSGYLEGRTPNPCARCNGYFRFPHLARLADTLGAGKVATGHYVRIEESVGKPMLRRGSDAAKDQAYMLWAVAPELLGRLRFPLGDITKRQTRELARRHGLKVHSRPESQEVCFIPGDDYRRFLRTRVEAIPERGDVLDSDGNRIGTHSGYTDYTVGQRRGLGISAPEPLYVLGTRPAENVVLAGSRDQLAVKRVEMTNVNEFVTDGDMGALQAQIRYNSRPAPARLIRRSPEGWTIELGEPVYGVAPGQSAVLYAGEKVVAGGVISASE